MTRTRYFDYKSPDSTRLLNNRLRGILQSGVYFGYNVIPGSSGMQLTLNMESDPDNTGSLLGKLITRDGVVVSEDAHLVDVAEGTAGHATLPRIDLLVCTYIYNAALPNNDVTYEVIAGTPDANPVAPAITDDQVIIAELTIPALTATITADMISDVNRKSLYSTSSIDLEDILRDGVYKGFFLQTGSDKEFVDLTAGTLITPEHKKVSEAATQADLFELNDTSGATFVRWDVIVCLHKFQDLEENPADYLLVEGTEVDEDLGAASAEAPDMAAIVTAAEAFNPKYDDEDYVTVLGYVRVQGTFAGVSQIEFYHTARIFPEVPSFYVRGKGILPRINEEIGSTYPWEFEGPTGLIALTQVIQSLHTSFFDTLDAFVPTWDRYNTGSDLNDRQPITIFCEGDFNFGPTQIVATPDYCVLEGVRTCRFLSAPHAWPQVLVGGVVAAGTIAASGPAQGVDQTGVAAGLERYEFDLDGDVAEWATMPGGINSFLFAGSGAVAGHGNAMLVVSGGNVYNFWFEERATTVITDDNFTLSAVGDHTAHGAFTTATRVIIYKKCTGIKNISIQQTNAVVSPLTQAAGDLGGFHCKAAHDAVLENIVTTNAIVSATNSYCKFDNISVNSHGWQTDIVGCDEFMASDAAADFGWPKFGYNKYGRIAIRPRFNANIRFGSFGGADYEVGAVYDQIVLDGRADQISDMSISFQLSRCQVGALLIRQQQDTTGTYNLHQCHVGVFVHGDVGVDSTATIGLTGDKSHFDLFVVNGTDSTVELLGDDITFGQFVTGNTSTGAVDPQAGRRQYDVGNEIANLEEDRNSGITSDGTFTWDLATQTLSSTASILIFRAFDATTVTVAPFSLVVNDLGAVRVRRGRSTFQFDSDLVATSVAAGDRDDERGTDSYFIAWRVGDKIYFRDGTVLEDGQTLALGVTAPSGFVSEFAKKFFTTSPVEDFPNEVVFLNTNVTMTYTALTGVVQYGSAVDLSDVVVGDVLILNSTPGVYNRFRIEAVDDGANTVTIQRGLTVNVTLSATADATAEWVGSIVRGNVSVRNPNLRTFTYTEATGIIQYSGTMSLGGVYAGSLFVDGAGVRHVIRTVDDTNNRLTIQTVPQANVDTTVATEMDGSIEIPNNPRGLQLNDLKSFIGFETITNTGRLHPTNQFTDREWHDSSTSDNLGAHGDAQYYTWDDPRVAVAIAEFMQVIDEAAVSTQTDTTWTGNNVGGGTSSPTVIVTFVGTGILFGMSGAQGLGANNTVMVDGVTTGITWGNVSPSGGPSTVSRGQTAPVTGMQVVNLPYGVHTVTMKLADALQKVIIFNQPNEINENILSEAPGRFWTESKFFDHPLVQSTTIPSSGTRGSSIVRYIPDSAPLTKAWATNALREFDTTAQANSTTTISNVEDLGFLAVGDLILVDDGSAPPELHVIAVVTPPNTITTVTAVGFTNPVTVTYKGATVRRQQSIAADEDRGGNCDLHFNEELEQSYSPGDFIDNDPINTDVQTIPTGAPIGAIDAAGHDAWDDIAFYGGVDATIRGPLSNATGATLPMFNGGLTTRFGFVGSGLDAIVQSFFPLTNLRIDGALVTASLVIQPSGLVVDAGGGARRVQLFGDLDYGYHMVEFDTASQLGFETYRPASPEVAGTKIMQTCRLAAYAAPRSEAAVLEAITDLPSGVIEYGAQTTHALAAANFQNDDTGDVSRGSQFNVVTSAAGTDVVFWFWGKRFTVIYTPSTAAGSTSNVTMYSQDTAEVAVSGGAAVSGYAVTGLTTITVPAASVGEVHRQTWEFDRCGLHAIKIDNWNSAADGAILIGFEVDSPFHTSDRFRGSRHWDGILKTHQSSLDLRRTYPLSPNLGKPEAIQKSFDFSVDGGAVDFNDFVIPVPSRGGRYQVTLQLFDVAADTDGEELQWDIHFDDPSTTPPRFTGLFDITEKVPVRSATFQILLPAGVNPVIVIVRAAGANVVTGTLIAQFVPLSLVRSAGEPDPSFRYFTQPPGFND